MGETIATDFKKIRERLSLTQEEVATALNRTRLTYQGKEKGRVAFTTDEFIAAVHLFAEILHQINKEPPTKEQQNDNK